MENGIHEAMKDWLEKYILEIEAEQQPKATVYRSPDSKLTVNIYPNLPK